MESAADELLFILENKGFSSYKVGGYVRDSLLGREVKDIDIATAASPGELIKIFPYCIPTGIKHGTVTVLFGGYPFEVTTFRIDKDYQDHRHPSQVEFVDRIEQDLSRRDFTINAMAMDRRGRIIDPYSGKQDLQRGIIRAVGNPEERFKEDALRILRGIRFAASFGFTLDTPTWEAMRMYGALLVHVSRERILAEWQKIIDSSYPLEGIILLSEQDLLPFKDWGRLFSTCIEHPKRNLLPQTQELALRLALLFIFCNIGEVYSFLSEWKFPKILIKEIQTYLHLISIPTPSELHMKKLLLTYGLDKVKAAFKVRAALGEQLLVPICTLQIWNEQIPIRKLTDLAIKGSDLFKVFDIPAGPWVGDTLQLLFERVAFFGLPNVPDQLLREARKVIQK